VAEGPYLRFILDGQVELELSGELILRVQPVREVHPSDATVSVDLESCRRRRRPSDDPTPCRDYVILIEIQVVVN